MPAEHPNLEGEFEAVHTVTVYYDGPRSDIADYQGKPYV